MRTHPVMLSIIRVAGTIALVLIMAGSATGEERFYVGQAVCRGCHHDPQHGDQISTWFTSAHARAYAGLARPESVEIARLSGIEINPHRSPICLGCHTTASDTEPWERDPAFHFEDGVQCELCHGPGSDYIPAEIMADPEAAMAAGLRMPDRRLCMICHNTKGSHTAALDVRPFDIEQALQAIFHSGGAGPEADSGVPGARAAAPRPGQPYLAGAMRCAACHNSIDAGYIFSSWRLSAHATATAVLAGERALEIAQSQGLQEAPIEAPQCLQCHATGGHPAAASLDPLYGVQCESCHGPAGLHADDPGSDHTAEVTLATCRRCHTPGIHGSELDLKASLGLIDHTQPDLADATRAEAPYKTPFNLITSNDGTRLLVVCEASGTLIVIDTRSRSVVAEIKVGRLPHGVAISPDDRMIYVSNRGSDSVSVIDAEHLEMVDTIAVGDEPHGLVTDAAGATLYVANAGTYDISVIDCATRKEIKRLSASRGTWDMARSPADGSILVSNNLSRLVPFRTTSVSEVTVIDPVRQVVRDRIEIRDANLLQGIAVAPHGELALVTLIRTKNLVPMTRVVQGWVMTNGLGILWPNGDVDELLLDEPDAYFADPTDVVITPDGRFAYATAGGINAVAVIDLERMVSVLEQAGERERREVLPNHTGVATEYVLRRIPVGTNPRGIAVSPDGRSVFVADSLDDAISVIDVATQERVAVIDLGGPKELTLARKGERIFHSAAVTFGGQFSCHSCHPDGGIDGVTYDIAPDGIGLNPVDNRSLRGILDTAPFKWTGKNPSLARQCGPRLAVFFTRIDPFTPEQVRALERYICTIPRNPNRYRAAGAPLTEAQRRGKLVFERTHANSGEEIPEANRCITCHPGPYFSDRQKVRVGAGSDLDTHDVFDVPHLNNIYETAPYLHDGRAETLEEIWTRFNPYDEHGVTNDMTKDQLNDLVEYLKTL